MKRRILPMLIAGLLCLLAVLPAAGADGVGSLNISFRHGNTPVAGVDFDIYRAAQLNGSAYELTGNFASYPVVLPTDEESGEWMTVAATLAAFAARDGIVADASGQTGASGIVSFQNLREGLYLVVGSPLTSGGILYMPQPFLVSIPYEDVDGSILYDVNVQTKYDYRAVTSEPVTRRVVKVWEDNGYEEARPQSVTVRLLRNGEFYDEQVLSESNNWQYTWTNLESGYDWKIVEVGVSGEYTVLIEEDGVTFTVTNTIENPSPSPIVTPTPTSTPSVTPTPHVTPTPSGSPSPSATPPQTPPGSEPPYETPSEPPYETPSGSPDMTPSVTPTEPQFTPGTEPPVDYTPSITPQPTKPPDLPHTGMLWWPVPILLAAGIVLLVVGAVIVIFRKGDNTDA